MLFALCLYFSVLEAPNTKTYLLCVQTHLAIKLFLILITLLVLLKGMQAEQHSLHFPLGKTYNAHKMDSSLIHL